MINTHHDFETQSAADLKKVGAYEYSMHPTTRIMCLAIKASYSSKMWFLDWGRVEKPFSELPSNFKTEWQNWVTIPNQIFAAHNSFFETCIYNNILVAKYGWPPIPISKRKCTAAKAAALSLPRSLAPAGEVMNLKIQKDPIGHRVMMKLCKPTSKWKAWNDFHNLGKRTKKIKNAPDPKEPPMFWTPETAPEDFKILYEYCKKDVLSEEELDKALPDLHPNEQLLWQLDQKINLRGVRVDMLLIKKIHHIMQVDAKTMEKELDEITMGLVQTAGQRDLILEILSFEGINMPDLKAKTVEEFLQKGEVTGDARRLLEIRKALSKSSTKKYESFIGRALSDGRVRDLFMYHGASTGRWTGKGLQVQNLPRGVIHDIGEGIRQIGISTSEELKLLYGENLMPLFSSAIRGMFIASEGKKLFVEDYSAIETRVLWWLADHKKGLELFAQDKDPYRELASIMFRVPLYQVTDQQRQVAKAAVLGCGYQMGHKKFKTSAFDVYGARVDEETAKLAVKTYREVHHPVVELWGNYNQACIYAIENPGQKYRVGKLRFFVENFFLWIELPSGRKLAYKDPFITWDEWFYDVEKTVNGKKITEKVKGGISKRVNYWAVGKNHQWGKEKTYGGKLTENIVQAVSRDLLAETIMRAENRGFEVLMHSHDELVCEAKMDWNRRRDYQELMVDSPRWAAGLPVKTKGFVDTRYRKD